MKKSNSQKVSPELCSKCKGRGWCGHACPILSKFSDYRPKPKKHFSGSSPPEIFVGRYGYPNVNTGILSPQQKGNTEDYSMPEKWHKKKFDIKRILGVRGKLIYGRFKSNIKDVRKQKKFVELMQEVSLAKKHVDTEFFLKKKPKQELSINSQSPVIGNPAPLKKARLEENPKVNRKAEYLSYDTDAKANTAMKELYQDKVSVSHITKVLSAGLLGRKKARKLVPSRWSITATDSNLSNLLLDRIKHYQEIGEIRLFHSEYLGNHYEILLLPNKFAFEVLEAKMSGSVWNPADNTLIMKDHEGFNGRKYYAKEVTGAYYANRLALAEYLEKIQRQASCLFMREARPEYYAPCGVGILREASRQAFKSKPEKFNTVKEALNRASQRLRLPVNKFKSRSWLLNEYRKQKRLKEWF